MLSLKLNSSFSVILLFFLLGFVFFFMFLFGFETESTSWGGVERKGDRNQSGLHTDSGDPIAGLKPTSDEIMP